MLACGLSVEENNGKVRLSVGDVSTGWIGKDDLFLKRIENLKLNPAFPDEHLAFEIEIKNILDMGVKFLRQDKPSKAIEMFDRVIYYDESYGVALLNKSYALSQQKHFVKSLRHYRKAIKSDASLKDNEYYRIILGQANEERDNFPKLKRNIYSGDEYFTKEEYEKALVSYEKALADRSRFKDSILFKLMNKTGTVYLKLEDYENALDCFLKSVGVAENDYGHFGCGICQYNLGLAISESFKRHLNLSKSRQLKQALILNELGFFREALEICDELFKNHFAVDDFYFRLINAKMYGMRQLDIDVSSLENLLEMINKEDL